MQIKAADDKQPSIDALNALLARRDVDTATRARIEDKLREVRAGMIGERDAAYQIEFDHGPSKKRMTIHDLRLEVGGRVAQIDHLIINRVLDFYVCESKRFADGVSINEHLEWTAVYGNKRYGIPSPVEQNRRHVAVLEDVFKQGLVKLPRRLGIPIRPRFKSVVLISNGATIVRPRGSEKVDGLDDVMKVEQLTNAIERDFDSHGDRVVLKAVWSSTIEELARNVAALHRPARQDWAATFGVPAVPVPEATRRPCDDCGTMVTERVVAYCRDNAAGFKGRILCYGCQDAVRATGR